MGSNKCHSLDIKIYSNDIQVTIVNWASNKTIGANGRSLFDRYPIMSQLTVLKDRGDKYFNFSRYQLNIFMNTLITYASGIIIVHSRPAFDYRLL